MNRGIGSRLLTIALIGLALGPAACGRTAGPPGTVAGTSPIPQRTIGTTLPGSSATVPAGAGTASPASPTGQVTVMVDKAHYAPTDTIGVVIFNGLTSAIATTDHQTGCTVVTLELSGNGTWQPQRPCHLATATRVVQLQPGATAQPLAPGDTTPWPAGTYRVAFTYFTGAAAATGAAQGGGKGGGPGLAPTQPGPVYSATFTIG